MAAHTVKVTALDGKVSVLTADVVLIATGASPRVLPNAEPDGDRILNWRQLYDLDELPEHLVVVGSGVTGAEFVNRPAISPPGRPAARRRCSTAGCATWSSWSSGWSARRCTSGSCR